MRINPDPAACDQGVAFITKYDVYDIKPNFSGRFPIYTLRSRAATSKVLRKDVNPIGDILVCQDWQTYWPQRNLVPAYYEITIGGRKYRAVGAGTSPNFPDQDVLPGGGQVMLPENYPEYGITYLNFTGTVLPARNGRTGGTFYTGNTFTNIDGNPSVYSVNDRVEARFTVDCARAHKAGDCRNLPYKDYLARGAVDIGSIRFTAGPALLPTPDGRLDGRRFFFATDAEGRINSWDMDLSLENPDLNVDTDNGLDSAWAVDGGATVMGRPGTWRRIESLDGE